MTLPDCMMPDGADPCAGYQQLAARVRELEAERDLRVAQLDTHIVALMKAEAERLVPCQLI